MDEASQPTVANPGQEPSVAERTTKEPSVAKQLTDDFNAMTASCTLIKNETELAFEAYHSRITQDMARLSHQSTAWKEKWEKPENNSWYKLLESHETLAELDEEVDAGENQMKFFGYRDKMRASVYSHAMTRRQIVLEGLQRQGMVISKNGNFQDA